MNLKVSIKLIHREERQQAGRSRAKEVSGKLLHAPCNRSTAVLILLVQLLPGVTK